MFWVNTQKYLGRVLIIIGNIALLVLVLRFFVVEPTKINGQSMEPTHKDSDFLLVNKISYLFVEPQRLDVVQFLEPTEQETLFVKRIVGMPGEALIIKGNRVYIEDNNEEILLDEIYLVDYYNGRDDTIELEIPEDHYVLLGDNRAESIDSRDFGPVHRKYIIGKIIDLCR